MTEKGSAKAVFREARIRHRAEFETDIFDPQQATSEMVMKGDGKRVLLCDYGERSFFAVTWAECLAQCRERRQLTATSRSQLMGGSVGIPPHNTLFFCLVCCASVPCLQLLLHAVIHSQSGRSLCT